MIDTEKFLTDNNFYVKDEPLCKGKSENYDFINLL